MRKESGLYYKFNSLNPITCNQKRIYLNSSGYIVNFNILKLHIRYQKFTIILFHVHMSYFHSESLLTANQILYVFLSVFISTWLAGNMKCLYKLNNILQCSIFIKLLISITRSTGFEIWCPTGKIKDVCRRAKQCSTHNINGKSIVWIFKTSSFKTTCF